MSGHPDGWSAFSRRDGDVLLVWDGVVSNGLYYVKPDDLSPYDGKNKEFSEEHAGEYFLFEGRTKVRVVGYSSENDSLVLVSLPDHIHTFGWGRDSLNYRDKFTFPSESYKFWYAEIEQLK